MFKFISDKVSMQILTYKHFFAGHKQIKVYHNEDIKDYSACWTIETGRLGCDIMVVGFTTTFDIYNQYI